MSGSDLGRRNVLRVINTVFTRSIGGLHDSVFVGNGGRRAPERVFRRGLGLHVSVGISAPGQVVISKVILGEIRHSKAAFLKGGFIFPIGARLVRSLPRIPFALAQLFRSEVVDTPIFLPLHGRKEGFGSEVLR